MELHEAQGPAEPTLPSLPRRFVDVFINPGVLVDGLCRRPVWFGAVLVVVSAVVIAWVFVPVELIEATQRQAMLDLGVDAPELTPGRRNFVRGFSIVAPALTALIFMFAYAGVCALVFTFVLGDEGSYRQYLAVVSHAWFIPSLVGLALTPLRISTGDLRLSLNLASFMFFLPEGYLLNVFRVTDLTFVWSSLVVARGASMIDRRRSFGSASAILLSALALYALAFGRLIPSW